MDNVKINIEEGYIIINNGASIPLNIIDDVPFDTLEFDIDQEYPILKLTNIRVGGYDEPDFEYNYSNRTITDVDGEYLVLGNISKDITPVELVYLVSERMLLKLSTEIELNHVDDDYEDSISIEEYLTGLVKLNLVVTDKLRDTIRLMAESIGDSEKVDKYSILFTLLNKLKGLINDDMENLEYGNCEKIIRNPNAVLDELDNIVNGFLESDYYQESYEAFDKFMLSLGMFNLQ